MKYFTRKIVMSSQLNGAGSLFGGQALAWIDEEAAVYVSCVLGTTKIVTKFMSNIDFKAPAHLGDIIEIGTELINVGTTSITVRCNIRNKSTSEDIVTVDKITFVNVDETGRPTPHGYKQ